MNVRPSKCLGGEGYLQQYFKGFIKLVAVVENICGKEYFLFPLSCRCLTGSVLGVSHFVPISAPKYDSCPVLPEIAC